MEHTTMQRNTTAKKRHFMNPIVQAIYFRIDQLHDSISKATDDVQAKRITSYKVSTTHRYHHADPPPRERIPQIVETFTMEIRTDMTSLDNASEA